VAGPATWNSLPSTCGLHHCPEIHLQKNSKLIYLAVSALEVFFNWALYKLTSSFVHIQHYLCGQAVQATVITSTGETIVSTECR